ncbi:MAG: hypothetical protein AAGD40_01565 [Pseudomonadota bacterium]
MPDLETVIVIAAAALVGAALVTGLAAWCWRGWLDLKRAELTRAAAAGDDTPESGPGPLGRIEVADLKERVRRLEAIAAGVDY